MSSLHANGIEIGYGVTGSGTDTLVLINGLGDALESWEIHLPSLLDLGLRVLRIDNRGIGSTRAAPGDWTSNLLARDVKAVVDHLGLHDFHLMGYSMGGMIAQEYALAFGSDLRSLTLACTYAAPGPDERQLQSMWTDLARTQGVPSVLRHMAAMSFTADFLAHNYDAVQAGAELSTMNVEDLQSQLHVTSTHHASERLASLSVPTLVIAAREDVLIPRALTRTVHDLIPGAMWVNVPGGHACLWEHPEEFTAAVTAFVAPGRSE